MDRASVILKPLLQTKIDRAPNPMELLTIHLEQPVEAGDMVRARKEGLINLYKEDGTSVTVRA